MMLTQAQHEAQQRYRERHRDELRAKWRLANSKRTKEQRSEANRKWRERHPDEVKRRNAEWRDANKSKHRADARRWRIENPDRFRANQRRWKDANPTYSRDYYHSTENRKATIKLRASLRVALLSRSNRVRSGGAAWRRGSVIGQLVGCSPAALRAHIEGQFTTGMSWENYGRGGWEIDHILPCNAFDLTDPGQQAACFHYTNLRPLWRPDNLSRPKGRA